MASKILKTAGSLAFFYVCSMFANNVVDSYKSFFVENKMKTVLEDSNYHKELVDYQNEIRKDWRVWVPIYPLFNPEMPTSDDSTEFVLNKNKLENFVLE